MLSKEQANTISEALLQQQLDDAIAGRNARGGPIPRYYRSVNFLQLEPYKQVQLIRQAEESAEVRRITGILAVVLASLGSLAWYITPASLKSPSILAIGFLFLPAIWSLRILLVRRVLRKLLAAQQSGS